MSTIRFGIGSVKLKTYKLKELGLDNGEDPKVKFEYHQYYFHTSNSNKKSFKIKKKRRQPII